MGRTGYFPVISPYCFAFSGWGELAGKVEKAQRRAGGGWAALSSQATRKGAGLRQEKIMSRERLSSSWRKLQGKEKESTMAVPCLLVCSWH